jgi:hypothetical protein
MGALTAKKKAFQTRPWESQSFVEIDDSEISLFKIRIENLKNKRVRVLPIKYWISDIKRFQPEKKYNNTSLFVFKLLLYYKLQNLNFEESFNIKYLSGIYLTTKKIVRYITKKPLNIILSKSIPSKTFYRFANQFTSFFLPNLLLPSSSLQAQKINFHGYSKLPLDLSNSFFLTVNPRLLSPTFNTFLFQNQDLLSLTSLGGFSINQFHDELPLSNYTISQIINNDYNKKTTKFIINQDDTRFSGLNVEIIQLSPLFLQADEQRYDLINKSVETIIDFDLSHSNKSNYKDNVFLSTYIDKFKFSSSIYIPNNIEFDKFLLTRISQKFLKRIEILFFLMIPHIKILNNIDKKYYLKKKRYSLINV